jgi:hypothetical protein
MPSAGGIAAQFFGVGQSRALAWARRPRQPCNSGNRYSLFRRYVVSDGWSQQTSGAFAPDEQSLPAVR